MGIATPLNGAAPPEVPLADIDLSTWDFWALDDDFRDGAFATLRREAPISFWPEVVQPGFEEGAGHWALTKLDDVFYASRHPDIFSSHPNITINDQPAEVSEFFGSMIVLDAILSSRDHTLAPPHLLPIQPVTQARPVRQRSLTG